MNSCPYCPAPSVVLVALVIGALGIPASVDAHMIITSHETRYGMLEIKNGPCGRAGGERSESVYTYTAGETITLTWDEFIPHPGYYRIAFDPDGHDAFEDPRDYNDLYTNDTVLVDDLFPHDLTGVSRPWTYDLELPNTPCDNCTLQLVQMMTDKPPYVVGTDDLYYNCIDMVLLPAEQPDAGTDVGTAPDVGSDPPETLDADASNSADSGRGSDVGTADPNDGSAPATGTSGGGCTATASRPSAPLPSAFWFVAAAAALLSGRRRALRRGGRST